MFNYDQLVPSDVAEGHLEFSNGALIHEITYADSQQKKVSAYLVTPRRAIRHPAIIFLHWEFGDRDSFLSEALLYADAGAVSLLVDASSLAGARTRIRSDASASSVADLRHRIATGLRRGVDLLAERKDVDPRRIAYVGHGSGATWGGALAGVEKRIRSYVLMAGSPKTERFPRHGAPLMPGRSNSIGDASPAQFLFQFALHDEVVSRKVAREYFKSASGPKRLEWYDTDHSMNLDAFAHRARWLHDQIGILPIELTPRRAERTLLPRSDLRHYHARHPARQQSHWHNN